MRRADGVSRSKGKEIGEALLEKASEFSILLMYSCWAESKECSHATYILTFD